MTQGDDSEEQVQAMRSVTVNLPLNAVPPATPDEVFHVDTQFDPETQKVVVLWDDIQQAFRNVVQVRNKKRVVPFLKGKDLRILEPRRIAAMQNTVLDVVVDDPFMEKEVASLQVQQLALQPISPHNDDSTLKDKTDSQNINRTLNPNTFPCATCTPIAPSIAISTVRRNPVYGLVEAAMENYNHIDRPLAFPLARGPHAAINDQPPTIKDPAVSSQQVNSSNFHLQGPQSATTNVPMEMDLVQISISASQGDKDAQVALGDMYRDGNGVAQDYQTAMDWYFKAAEQGDAAGQQRVGGFYDEGFGVSQDFSIAMDWYIRAANQGDAESQYKIGELYFFGLGVLEDHAQAMYWIMEAANQGHASALHRIGFMYDDGHAVPQDYAQAMYWYLKAADQGNASSQSNIGFLYQEGLGVPQDYRKAMDWYLKAAIQGNASAQYNIGTLYQEGQGVPQDYALAMDWYFQAASQGNTAAQSNIGYLYRHGHGVLQDRTKAIEWFQKAADQGDVDSESALKNLSEELAGA